MTFRISSSPSSVMSTLLRWMWPWLLTLFLLFHPIAEAQRSGGRIGGGSFRSASRSFTRRSYSSSRGHSIHHDTESAILLARLVVYTFRYHPLAGTVIVISIVVFLILVRGSPSASNHPDDHSVASTLPNPQSHAWLNVDITELKLAIDARARPFLQLHFLNFAKKANVKTPYGRHELLSFVIDGLRRSKDAWIYAGGKNFQPMSPILAEAQFRKLSTDARSKYTHEIIEANEQGVYEREGHGVRRSAEREGEGVVLITLIVASHCEIADFDPSSRSEIHKLLRSLSSLPPDSIVAIELIWMPADPEDRMSTATLEAIDPTLHKLSGAIGGVVFCEYCRGPYTAELHQCPHCGAPNSSSRSPQEHPSG
ncbi:MAG: DUF1517 domain-containing protein [Sandaracinaceae bacterium]|nr:DUF1517 domain-containing protein [Sandaracinaceae bacterium]